MDHLVFEGTPMVLPTGAPGTARAVPRSSWTEPAPPGPASAAPAGPPGSADRTAVPTAPPAATGRHLDAATLAVCLAERIQRAHRQVLSAHRAVDARLLRRAAAPLTGAAPRDGRRPGAPRSGVPTAPPAAEEAR
ncbi:hypothetical protein ACIQVT_25905 [Streptomyces sp. NPDC100445]|uniref:hypothetical protein n=1 Tax=Streptomyces sp. NPDC100445 TaxID=3366102 RepID=UPI00380811EF